LVDFYTYVELNKDTMVECPHGKSMWQWWCVNYCQRGRNILLLQYILTCHQNLFENILANMDGI
jgi:hypothetical protein